MFRCCFPHGKRTGADAPAKDFLFGSRLLFQRVQHGPVHFMHPCRARFEFHAVGGELAIIGVVFNAIYFAMGGAAAYMEMLQKYQ